MTDLTRKRVVTTEGPLARFVLITIALGRQLRAVSTSRASGTHGPRFSTSKPHSSSSSCRNIRFQVWESEEVVDNRIRWPVAGTPSVLVRSAVIRSTVVGT